MHDITGYELIEKIADGGMATVWKARQLSLDRMVAIKVLGTSSLPDQEARDRFRKEAQIAAKLNHPGIVQVIDTGEVGRSAYLVMEYVNGCTVGDMIRNDGPIPEARALDIIGQVARALAYAWEKECLIHCDIKPDNILVDRVSGMVKVADLGLARLIGLIQTGADSDLIIGTPNYASPELSTGETDLDCRTDLYSLGATLYHMVTGVLPFRDAPGSQAMTRHETDFLEDPVAINPSVSIPTAWLIEKWMIKNRAFRTHFWTMALKDIEEVQKGRLPAPPLPDPGTSTVRHATERSQVKNTKPKVMITPNPDGPRKLTIRKNELPEPVAPPPRRGSLGGFFGTLFSLLFTGACLYGVVWYHGYAPWPDRDFLRQDSAPAESAEPATEEPAWDDAPPAPAEDTSRDGIWRNDDFLKGARLFNQALADYNTFQSTRQNRAILPTVAENCRLAIEHFEACRDLAPEHIDIGQYIDQCYGMIANVRHSTQLTDEQPSAPSAPSTRDDQIVIEMGDAPAAVRSVVKNSDVVFVDDESVAEPPPVESAPVQLLRVALETGWEKPTPGYIGFAQDLKRLLTRHVQPTRRLEVDASALLYPGITCMTTAREAAKTLKQELPIRRPLSAPGFPSGGLFYYEFAGDFSGAQRLTLVVDLNDRVVMAQLNDDREVAAKMEEALFSPTWSSVDFIHARKRGESDGLLAHRVRRRDNVIRIDTELAASGTSAAGTRPVAARVMLMMPEQMAGILLQCVSTGP